MSTPLNLLATLGVALLVAAPAPAQDAAAPSSVQDVFEPGDAVAARQALKAQVAVVRGLVEGAVAEGDEDAFFDAADDLATISAILQAFPHLFPVSSSPDGLSAEGADVATDASPEIWDDFSAFAAMADSVSASALAASQSVDFAALSAASVRVWAGCTACHDAYHNYDPFADMGAREDVEIDSPFF